MKQQSKTKQPAVRELGEDILAGIGGADSGPSDANRILERSGFLNSDPSDSNRILGFLNSDPSDAQR